MRNLSRADDFIAAIGNMVKATNESDQIAPEPLEAACWFIAVQEAKVVLDSRPRDIAEFIRAGEPLAGPYNSVEDVQQWLDMWFGTDDDPEPNCMKFMQTQAQLLLDEMARHFGLI